MQQSQQSPHAFSLQSQTSAPASYGMSPLPSASLAMSKELNPISMCLLGQEIVHEIISRAQEIFSLLTPKSIQVRRKKLLINHFDNLYLSEVLFSEPNHSISMVAVTKK